MKATKYTKTGKQKIREKKGNKKEKRNEEKRKRRYK